MAVLGDRYPFTSPQKLADRDGGGRAFSDGGGHLLDTPVANVAGGKDARHATFEGERIQLAIPTLQSMEDIVTGHHETIPIQLRIVFEEGSVWHLPDEDEGCSGMDLIHVPCLRIADLQSLHFGI